MGMCRGQYRDRAHLVRKGYLEQVQSIGVPLLDDVAEVLPLPLGPTGPLRLHHLTRPKLKLFIQQNKLITIHNESNLKIQQYIFAVPIIKQM